MRSPLHQAFDAEWTLARQARQRGDLGLAFHHLERAHILGQRSTRLHVRSHLGMLAVGWQRRDAREVAGQLVRIVAAALPHFRVQGFGNFVSVVSVANYCFPPGDALSSVPKAGIEALGRAIAKEEGRYGIRANMVAPGIINAGLGAEFLTTLYTPAIWEAQRKRIALQRFGDGEDIAQAVAFLASERARYITGQTLIVDGGFSL